MKKVTSGLLGLLVVMTAGCGTIMESPESAAGTYGWLHPKQGMVKVDRRTNAIVSSGSATKDGARMGASPR